MKTTLLQILDLVKSPPEPECNYRKGMFKFGFLDQVRRDWCAFIRKGKTDVQKKNRCNRPDPVKLARMCFKHVSMTFCKIKVIERCNDISFERLDLIERSTIFL